MLAVGFAACDAGGDLFDDGRELGVAPERKVIDERAGSYRGVGLGDPTSAVLKEFGRKYKETSWLAPTALEPGDDFDAAPVFSCGGKGLGLRRFDPHYKYVTYLTALERVCGWTAVEDGAATEAGVAIGDPLSDAEEAYPKFICGTAEGSEYPSYPYCTGSLVKDHFMWFGGDPINTIQANDENLKVR